MQTVWDKLTQDIDPPGTSHEPISSVTCLWSDTIYTIWKAGEWCEPTKSLREARGTHWPRTLTLLFVFAPHSFAGHLYTLKYTLIYLYWPSFQTLWNWTWSFAWLPLLPLQNHKRFYPATPLYVMLHKTFLLFRLVSLLNYSGGLCMCNTSFFFVKNCTYYAKCEYAKEKVGYICVVL